MYASAVVGVDEIQQHIAKASNSAVNVRLFFAELEGLKPGERVFDVAIQGKPVLKRFDIAGEAGGGLQIVPTE